MVTSFLALSYYGYEIYRQAPPIPSQGDGLGSWILSSSRLVSGLAPPRSHVPNSNRLTLSSIRIQAVIGVAFWNFVGAGIFGFLINAPIALDYMQGLNTTPVHAHTALLGYMATSELASCYSA